MKKTKKYLAPTEYPMYLIRPVYSFLSRELKRLERTKREIVKDDPFKNTDRLTDNAAPDADAEEQFGHARSTAIRDQLDWTIIQTRRALARVKLGKYGVCERCGNMINTDRLMVKPEATLCVKCEARKES